VSILICLIKKLTTKVHAYLSDGALAPDGLVDRDIMDAAINEARTRRHQAQLKPEEIFDFRLMKQVKTNSLDGDLRWHRQRSKSIVGKKLIRS